MPTRFSFMTVMICALGVTLLMARTGHAAQPTPIGMNTIRIQYETTGGMVSFDGMRDYAGETPADAFNLNAASNVGTFNSINSFGRRTAVAPLDPSVIGPDESLVTHAFFKIDGNNQFDTSLNFFPDILPGSDITISVENIQFDQPVTVLENTFLMHMFWDGVQVDNLGLNDQNQPRAYDNLHNHYIPTGFRDLSDFVGTGRPFTDNPVPNYATFDDVPSANLDPQFTMNGPDSFDLSFAFPYSLMQHMQDDGMGAPEGLPGPAGFLEPFHFHLEYLVAPEPATLLIVALGGLLLTRRRSAPDRGCR